MSILFNWRQVLLHDLTDVLEKIVNSIVARNEYIEKDNQMNPLPLCRFSIQRFPPLCCGTLTRTDMRIMMFANLHPSASAFEVSRDTPGQNRGNLEGKCQRSSFKQNFHLTSNVKCARDSSGKPTVRNEWGLAANSPAGAQLKLESRKQKLEI